MSVILDALKKLDREKSSRRNGTANIAVEILRADLPRPGKRVPRYAAIAFLTAFATAAVTYGVMVKGGFLSKSTPPPAVNPAAPRQEAAPAPPSSEPVPSARDEINPEPPNTQAPVKSKKPATSLAGKKVDETKTRQNVTVKEADIVPEKANTPVERPPQASTKPAPSLNISAIVWYEEPSRRFAMINGLIVTEGSVVEGMKVEEIYPDRVRFLQQNQHLEIFIK